MSHMVGSPMVRRVLNKCMALCWCQNASPAQSWLLVLEFDHPPTLGTQGAQDTCEEWAALVTFNFQSNLKAPWQLGCFSNIGQPW